MHVTGKKSAVSWRYQRGRCRAGIPACRSQASCLRARNEEEEENGGRGGLKVLRSDGYWTRRRFAYRTLVLRMISSKPIAGLKPTALASFSITGLRRRMSSKPGAYA